NRVTSHITPSLRGRGWGGATVLWVRNSALMSSVKSVSSVREKILSESQNVLFLTEYTEEQNTQGFTETLSQPITQNLTAIFGCYAL
ncbi:hypothetical protein HMPREF0666_01527, partial [Prevotella sp. C561]